MSPADKKNIMKSTIKIDYERTMDLCPVIKIIMPKSAGFSEATQELTPGFNETTDEDVKDKLLRDFIQLPCMAVPNSFFEISTRFPIRGELELITIAPIMEKNLFSRFRWAILHRLVRTSSISVFAGKGEEKGSLGARKAHFEEGEWNEINRFFDWLDQQEYAPTE